VVLAQTTTSSTPRRAGDAFDDLLSAAHGFVSSAKTASSATNNRSLADLCRANEIHGLDPIQIKIRDWTQGKKRNIRALIGSLNDVLWTDALTAWAQPSMADLFVDAQIKKHYRKACLVVHPDKQPQGTERQALAKAIFTELNDAWNEFEQHPHNQPQQFFPPKTSRF